MAKNKNEEVKQPVKQEEKINPSDKMAQEDANKVRKSGNWISATPEEVAKHEAAGKLVGHDRETGMVLLKEE